MAEARQHARWRCSRGAAAAGLIHAALLACSCASFDLALAAGAPPAYVIVQLSALPATATLAGDGASSRSAGTEAAAAAAVASQQARVRSAVADLGVTVEQTYKLVSQTPFCAIGACTHKAILI